MTGLGRPRPTHTGCALVLLAWTLLLIAGLTAIGITVTQ